MKIIVCFQKKNRAKIFGSGNVLDMLVITTTICRAVAEKIANEMYMEYGDAIKFLISSIYETYGKN